MWLTELRVCVLMLRGRNEAAVPLFEKILEFKPNDPGLGLVLQHYRKKRDYQLVRQYAERALAEESSNFTALDALAWAHISQGQHAQAKPVVERAIRSAEALEHMTFPRSILMRALIAVVGPAVAIWKGKNPARAPTAEMIADEGKRWIEPWKQWAHRYLEWHSRSCDVDVSGKDPV